MNALQLEGMLSSTVSIFVIKGEFKDFFFFFKSVCIIAKDTTSE